MRLGNQRPWYVQPCLCDWVIKDLGMSSRVCATGHIKDPMPLIEKSRALKWLLSCTPSQYNQPLPAGLIGKVAEHERNAISPRLRPAQCILYDPGAYTYTPTPLFPLRSRSVSLLLEEGQSFNSFTKNSLTWVSTARKQPSGNEPCEAIRRKWPHWGRRGRIHTGLDNNRSGISSFWKRRA